MNEFDFDAFFPKREKPYTDDELIAMELENERIIAEYENDFASGLY